jgi:FkbM family methyltransferase
MSELYSGPDTYYTKEHLEALHQNRNAGIRPGRLVLREGIEIGIAAVARHPALAFTCDTIMTREFDQFLDCARDKVRLLDVGSLHGIFSLAFTARAGTAALAIDPSPIAVEGLRENCRLNPSHDIRVLNMAAGASEGTIAMRFEGIHLQAVGPEEMDTAPIRQVAVQPVDTILADQRFQPDIVKIDVEGYEHEVLLGMTRTIQCFRPELHIEIHGRWLKNLGTSFGDVIRLLWSMGYKVTLLDGYEPKEADFDYFAPTLTHARCVHELSAWERRVSGPPYRGG